MVGRIVLLALGVAWAASSAAQVSVSLPLNGYYRPGKYMPVRVSAAFADAPAGDAITLSGNGIVPTVLPLSGGRAEAVVPVLALTPTAGPLLWARGNSSPQPAGRALRPIDEGERLVGVASGEPPPLEAMFPEQAAVSVALDRHRPLPGAAEAWGSLDEVCLDELPAGLPIGELLAGGMAVAVRSSRAPDSRWRWRRDGDWWTLRPQLLGPRTCLTEAAYLPTYSWAAGRPAWFRRQVVAFAVLFCIAILAALLWRSRWSLAVIALACAASAAGVTWWSRRQSPLLRQGGSILVISPSMQQQDRWTYLTTPSPTNAVLPVEGVTWPVLAGAHQAQELHLSLRCAPDGGPDHLAVELAADHRVAFLSRNVSPTARKEIPANQAASPLAALVRNVYLTSGTARWGQLAAGEDAESWPTIIIESRGRVGETNPP